MGSHREVERKGSLKIVRTRSMNGIGSAYRALGLPVYMKHAVCTSKYKHPIWPKFTSLNPTNGTDGAISCHAEILEPFTSIEAPDHEVGIITCWCSEYESRMPTQKVKLTTAEKD